MDTGSWNFGNNYSGNVVMFGDDNSSSSHTDNLKNNLSVLDEGQRLILTEALAHQRKSLILTLLKQI